MRKILLIFISLHAVPALTQDDRVLTLSQAVKQATENAPSLQAAIADQAAAEASVNSANSSLYPKLSLEGNYKKYGVVPKATIGNQTLQLSDDHSYSIGPTLSYVLWDSGQTRNRIHALEFLAQAKKNQSKLSKAQVILGTQIAYIQVALASENFILSSKAAELSKVQNKDIAARTRGGSATRLDVLNSDSDVLNYQLKVEQAETDLLSNLSELTYYTGAQLTPQTQFDLLANLISTTDILKHPQRSNISSHPLIEAHIQIEKSILSQANAQRSLYWPTLTFLARSSLDYPNGSTLEQINQNSLGVNLTWTLFDFGGNKNGVVAEVAKAQAAASQSKDAKNSLTRDFEKASGKIEGLKKQMKDAEVFVLKQEQLAKLNYSNFKYGSLRFSDVQTANLRLLDAQNRLSLIRAQYLVQVFTLQYLNQGVSNE